MIGSDRAGRVRPDRRYGAPGNPQLAQTRQAALEFLTAQGRPRQRRLTPAARAADQPAARARRVEGAGMPLATPSEPTNDERRTRCPDEPRARSACSRWRAAARRRWRSTATSPSSASTSCR
jgi:hypothetical protein